MVDKITGLNGMRNLKILSIGRNYIKTISGLASKQTSTLENASVMIAFVGVRRRYARRVMDELQLY